MRIIDFHSHILPNIDDGCRGIEMARNVLMLAKSQRTSLQILTPHFYASRSKPEEFLAKRSKSYDSIREIIDKSMLEVRLGCEIAFTRGMSEWDCLGDLAIEGTKLVLVEMPFRQWTDKDLAEIEHISEIGFIPILAHLERFYD